MDKAKGWLAALLIIGCMTGCSRGGAVPPQDTGGQAPTQTQMSPVPTDTGQGTKGGHSQEDGANSGNGNAAGSSGGSGESVQPSPASSPDSGIAQQVANMSLDEKLGQMIIAGVAGSSPSKATQSMIASQHVGGIIFYKDNLIDPKGVVHYVNQLKVWNKDNPAPLFLSLDEEGGRVSRLPGVADLPTGRAVGKVNDTDYAAKIGSFLGAACSAMGINLDFAPVLDINSNPNNPVIGDRSFGATSDLVTRTGISVMNGIKSTGVIPVVKHFPGHGDTSVDSHLELPVVNKTLKQLQGFEWLPFQKAIEDGADAVMIAHILFPKLDAHYPASLSKTVITGELRGTLGFKGVVITDDLTMGAIAKHYGMGEAAVRTVKAGSDILLVAHGYDNVTSIITALKTSIAKGDITESRIDESVTRILTLKRKYGLTDNALGKAADLSRLNQSIRDTFAGH